MTKLEFLEKIYNNRNDLCVSPTSAQEALDLIADYLLGKNYYISFVSESVEQTNTELLFGILDKTSKDFRKDLKTYEKFRNRFN